MIVSAGADAVILNPFDNILMDTAKTAKLLSTKGIYCDSYLKARPSIAYNFEPDEFPGELLNSSHMLWE